MRLLWLLILLPAALARDPVRDVTYLSGPSQVPKFDSGFVFERVNNEFFVFGRDGSRALTVTIPDGVVTDAAVAPDDTFAAGYRFLDKMGEWQGALAFLDSAGKITKTIVTGLFSPGNLCFSPAGYLWVYGWQHLPGDREHEDPDSSVLRKYSRTGEEQGRYLYPSQAHNLIRGCGGCIVLQASRDHIGMLAQPTNDSRRYQWLELDFEGKLIRRVEIGNVDRVAFTLGGELYALSPYEKNKPRALMRLNPVVETWEAIKDSLPEPGPNVPLVGIIAGADGDQVVLHSSPGERLRWFAVR